MRPISLLIFPHRSTLKSCKGLLQRIFGSQAFSGAINIVTKPLGDALFLKAEGGSYGTFREELRSSHHWQRFNMTLSRSMQRSDGAVENGDYKTNKVFWTGRLSLPRFVLNLKPVRCGTTLELTRSILLPFPISGRPRAASW